MMKRMSIQSTLIGWMLVFFSFQVSQVCAGTLDDFEQGVGTPSKAENSQGSSGRRAIKDESDDDSGGLTSYFVNLFFNDFIFTGGSNSFYKANSSFDASEHPYLNPRKKGYRIIPFARFDLSFGDMNSDIKLSDSTIEFGFGAISVMYRHSQFKESSPSDKLELDQLFFNYRMTFSDQAQWDVGLGDYSLEGNRELSGSAVRFGFTWLSQSRFGVEFNYITTTGNQLHINDREFALLYSLDYVSIKVAHRYIYSSNNGDTSLRGPSLGFSFHF